jgi:hypothetical protein
MSRKDSTKKAAKRNAREESRKRLANAIAEIMANPETPSELYNRVGDITVGWIDDYNQERGVDSADYILDCLKAHQQSEEKRTKGGRD